MQRGRFVVFAAILHAGRNATGVILILARGDAKKYLRATVFALSFRAMDTSFRREARDREKSSFAHHDVIPRQPLRYSDATRRHAK